jgi:large subunit ribosomal protein L4
MRQQAIRCALSALLRDEQLVFVDDFNIDTPKTKEMDKALQELTGSVKTLVLLPEANENVQRALANLSYARWLRVNYLNMRDLLQYEKVIVPLAALDVIQTLWGRKEA